MSKALVPYQPTAEAPQGLCLWCRHTKAIGSHALKKRSLGGKETIPLCIECDLWFDEHHANITLSGDFLVGTTLDGEVLGMVPARPEPFDIKGLLTRESLWDVEKTVLKADDDSLYGALGLGWEMAAAAGWLKRAVCYAIKTRDGWRENWNEVASQHLRDAWGVTISTSHIYAYAQQWELLHTPALGERVEALSQLQPSILGLLLKATDLPAAADLLIENGGTSIRRAAHLLQERGLVPARVEQPRILVEKDLVAYVYVHEGIYGATLSGFSFGLPTVDTNEIPVHVVVYERKAI